MKMVAQDSIIYTKSFIKDLGKSLPDWLESTFKDLLSEKFNGMRPEAFNYHIRMCFASGQDGFELQECLQRAALLHSQYTKPFFVEDYLSSVRHFLKFREKYLWAKAASPMIFFNKDLEYIKIKYLINELREVFDFFPHLPGIELKTESALLKYINLCTFFLQNDSKCETALRLRAARDELAACSVLERPQQLLVFSTLVNEVHDEFNRVS